MAISYTRAGAVTNAFLVSLGLYSLSGSTLSLANSVSGSLTLPTNANIQRYFALTDISAAQNITPGTWFMGIVMTSGVSGTCQFAGAATVLPDNAFAGGFNGGGMTETTVALPASYATSDLDTTGANAMEIPLILLTA